MDIVEAESPIAGPPAQLTYRDGSLLLSVKAAATHLGVPTGTIYQLINSGEIDHVLIGHRRYITRNQLTAFIDAHSHTGYTPSR
jgi:excisionase family DNA binding protein